MSKLTIVNLVTKNAHKVAGMLSKYAPQILTGVGVIGTITTAVLASEATLKAHDIYESEFANVVNDENVDLANTKKTALVNTAKKSWSYYVPTTITGAFTVTAIICANKISLGRSAALAGLYSISEKKLKEYKNKVVEELGEKKAEKIDDAIALDRVMSNPPMEGSIEDTGNGSTLCLDTISGRYFKSDYQSVRNAENEINSLILSDEYASLNDYYRALGLTEIRIGELLGWNIDNRLKVKYSSQLTPKGTPVMVVDYSIIPKEDYQVTATGDNWNV